MRSFSFSISRSFFPPPPHLTLFQIIAYPLHFTIKTRTQEIKNDIDLAGPILLMVLLGSTMLLRGRIHFGFIYGFFSLGCCSLWLILNLMSQEKYIKLLSVFSVLGYSLLPIVGLSTIAIVLDLQVSLVLRPYVHHHHLGFKVFPIVPTSPSHISHLLS